MKKRSLLTGAGGFVGSRIDFADVAFPTGALREASMDDVYDFVLSAQPEVIYHTAAISDIGACEKDPEGSYRAGVLLPLTLAKAANACGAKLVAFSSDQVYTGLSTDGVFAENAHLSPTNLYAKHKLEAENRVLDLCPDTVFLRATWMYDFPVRHAYVKPNFLTQLLSAHLTGERVSASDSDFRGITYVREVIDRLPAAAELPGGVYNFGSPAHGSMWDTVCAITERAHLHLRPERTTGHPRSLAMDGTKLQRNGIAFSDTVDGFLLALSEYGILPLLKE